MLKAITSSILGFVGACTLVAVRIVRALPKIHTREIARAVAHNGFDSLPLTLVTSAAIGATVMLQAGVYANTFGARLYTGWAAGYALIWEFGPLLLSLVMAARIGARHATELGLLSVSGQLEGFRGMGIDLFPSLLAPRFIGHVLSMTLLIVIMFASAIMFEAVAAKFTLNLPIRVFFSSFDDMIHLRDIAGGMLKTLTFAMAIALISTTVGLNASGGATGVGRAAAASVVLSCAATFALDFLVTPFLSAVLS